MTNGTPLITFILGTRPEIIKLSPIIRECVSNEISNSIIHTGQHYSKNMDRVFFDQLELPDPDHDLKVGSGNHGQQTGEMITRIERVLLQENPEVVLVQGDTNSVLAGAIAADKLECKLGHVEAGLRSFDRNMPEESNRLLADHISDYLFVPTEKSAAQLRKEGISDERIFVTGNTVVDAINHNKEIAERKSHVIDTLELEPNGYGLMTLHREENVTKANRFRNILHGVADVADTLDIPIIYPIHPGSMESMKNFDLDVPHGIHITEPMDYLDFINLERNTALILTDSGGVQEEACIFKVPCVTVRDNTERPETVEVGANTVVGTGPNDILRGALEMVERPTNWENPFGDGFAAQRILNAIESDDQNEVNFS